MNCYVVSLAQNYRFSQRVGFAFVFGLVFFRCCLVGLVVFFFCGEYLNSIIQADKTLRMFLQTF